MWLLNKAVTWVRYLTTYDQNSSPIVVVNQGLYVLRRHECVATMASHIRHNLIQWSPPILWAADQQWSKAHQELGHTSKQSPICAYAGSRHQAKTCPPPKLQKNCPPGNQSLAPKMLEATALIYNAHGYNCKTLRGRMLSSYSDSWKSYKKGRRPVHCNYCAIFFLPIMEQLILHLYSQVGQLADQGGNHNDRIKTVFMLLLLFPRQVSTSM